MGKKTHMGNSRKAVHKLNSSSVKNNKSTCSHKCGPSDHGRNVAPEMSAHNTGPRYIPKSNKISSQRIQIGCILPDFDSSRSSIKSLKAKRRRIAKKRRKQLLALSPISLDGSKPMDRDDTMDKKFTYFSGGVNIPFNDKFERVYSVLDDLKVIHTPQIEDYSRGLIFQRVDSLSADIILCPRNEIISRGLDKSDMLCNAFDVVIKATKITLRGSKSQSVRGDPYRPLQYSCIGTHVIQGGAGGITPFSVALEKVDLCTRKTVQKYILSVEHLYSAYVSNEEIEILTKAIKLTDASTFTMPPSRSNPSPQKAKYYGAMAVGQNVFLATHTDKDYAYSAVSVHCRFPCQINKQRILAYFAFPALGIAIPLRIGDVLFFNPNEPHCFSSRVTETDHLYCVSLYLKSALIGLNDNSIQLTDAQKSALEYKKSRLNLAI